jgi:phosphomevalonate kinase
MSVAQAPGKVVLSGAYSVLFGAPAIVSAVGRCVVADSSRPAELVTPEVQAALRGGERAPWFDAAALRADDRKLGLGSSAAILVASLYALERDGAPAASEPELRQRVFERALVAHRTAQAGGSGVDVAASTFGGTLCYQLAPPAPSLVPLALPPQLTLEIWTCPVSASTRQLLEAVAELAQREPGRHQQLLAEQGAAAERAVQAVRQSDAPGLIVALRAQHRALDELGRAAGVPIVTPALCELEAAAEAQGGVLLPAGAGGGDIALFAGAASSTPALRAALAARAHEPLRVELAAPGVGLVQ